MPRSVFAALQVKNLDAGRTGLLIPILAGFTLNAASILTVASEVQAQRLAGVTVTGNLLPDRSGTRYVDCTNYLDSLPGTNIYLTRELYVSTPNGIRRLERNEEVRVPKRGNTLPKPPSIHPVVPTKHESYIALKSGETVARTTIKPDFTFRFSPIRTHPQLPSARPPLDKRLFLTNAIIVDTSGQTPITTSTNQTIHILYKIDGLIAMEEILGSLSPHNKTFQILPMDNVRELGSLRMACFPFPEG